ncbi:hypothetical protein GCM10025868_02470 [Angustibacter aerolatus]|uniref:Uncharacterized protein n=1 Tax=Angustibacter aerolatus TaxID=1162965 RepID=A0ABQ6JB34_9ACTN|nr:hypothetical protein GCM10025868_02470 [Angustibacter aerolatus]
MTPPATRPASADCASGARPAGADEVVVVVGTDGGSGRTRPRDWSAASRPVTLREAIRRAPGVEGREQGQMQRRGLRMTAQGRRLAAVPSDDGSPAPDTSEEPAAPRRAR